MFGATVFAPFYDPGCRVTVHGAGEALEKAFRTVFGHPIFPVPFDALPGNIFLESLAGCGSRVLDAHGVELRWGQVSHPQGCTAYRVDDGENALVFATDVELEPSEPNRDLVGLMCDPYPAGLAIIDGFFRDVSDDYHAGWGHSTWRQAWDWCLRCGVERLAVTHHNPGYADSELLALERSTGCADIVWARDSQAWSLCSNHAVCH
jgi:phosphoribosyl 1,2-cyclic phosphodiesterase